jgi:EAL domain-containing protein (putative c-di-GMP-specific phosphodiesterase class I)
MALLAGYREILKSISRLRREGFSVGIDEFGAGFTSLGILRDVKADRLRLNMDFIEGGEIGYRGEIILNSIVGLGRELGMKVLASGVENEEQRELLTEMGCNLFEGSLFADPMTANEFEKKYVGKQEPRAAELS